MKIAITGATGYIGRRLVRRLLDEGGNRVLAWSRRAAEARARLAPEVEVVEWAEPVAAPPPAGSLDGVDAVIHLAGEPVGQRWSPQVKARIRESRVNVTRNLVAGIASARVRPPVLVSMSAVGYYGPRGDEPLDESAAPGKDFLSELCRDWEAEAARAREAGARAVTARMGLVLGPRGGALARMLPFFKMFLGGPLGDGRQWMSWIHVDDALGILLHAVRTEALDGPVNATSPNPVRNAEFARTLGAVLGRPSGIPTPPAALRLLLGEFADMLLAGQRVLPRKAEAAGYRYRYPLIETALREILAG
jgi:uncharacterized protein